jgi:predicted ATPase
MRLKSLEIQGLLGRENYFKTNFNNDINIVTGRNGSGKTSVLKLLWYVISGNIHLALKETEFSSITVETSEYDCTVHRLSRNTCEIEWRDSNGIKAYADDFDENGNFYGNAEDIPNKHLRSIGSSVFLPTFRRIEGGFSIGEQSDSPFDRVEKDIEEALTSLSRRLSNNSHTFVTSLSTVDIVKLLAVKYTDISEQANKYQQEVSQSIITTIKNYEERKFPNNDTEGLYDANQILKVIVQQIEGMETNRTTTMKPLRGISTLVGKVFKHKHSGIRIGKNFSFGDAATAVNSDLLSAGEQQMLSFIAYNALYQDSVIIIDEPELSLHVDWQRQLFAILLGQKASNQFVVATHSPFIYSKYPDKEILLDAERGDEGGDDE